MQFNDPSSVRTTPFSRAALVAALVAALAMVLVPSSSSRAADLSSFDPGFIISDAEFYNGDGMTLAEIEAFIQTKGRNCVAGNDGTPCLKDFTMDTRDWDPSPRCLLGYQGAENERAATIIYKVAQSCNVNPKAILVILQKERGLITASGSSLTSSDFRIAMGYGCPDTAGCDTSYYGFQNQVINGAAVFQRYRLSPLRYRHRAGATITIAYHPNAACGGASVYIRNSATAGLYNYTPYQPNQAALDAGYAASANPCSSYGNRNFFNYYNDWFPSAPVTPVLPGPLSFKDHASASEYQVGPQAPSAAPSTSGDPVLLKVT